MSSKENTICALTTPQGQGAVAIIRLSGPDTFTISDAITAKRKGTWASFPSHTVHYCKVIDRKDVIDDVLISLFKNPQSYTGEDVAEINCHASPYIIQRILAILLKHGAQLAKPGEFTMRAFLNGKLDLTQAEAVADLIASQSKEEHDVAMNQMRGGFSSEIAALRDKLLQFASLIELELDFSEEDIEFANRKALIAVVKETLTFIGRLVKSFELGNVIKNGIPVAIVGKPNVGKSTLLNALLNEERAIVSEIPGTTRDTIEDTVHLGGYTFRFIDTAGLRHTTDIIESLGIERTKENIRKARIILLMVDANEPIEDIVKQYHKIAIDPNQSTFVIVNKIDKYPDETCELEKALKKTLKKATTIYISAKKGIQVHMLTETLLQIVNKEKQSQQGPILTNMRHVEALQATSEAGTRVIQGLTANTPTDLVAQDIREMLYYLGTITGEITTDEILGNIFKNFCIGK